MPGSLNPACPECGRRVDEFDAAAVRAVKQPATEGIDEAEQGNGHDRLFHAECFPAARGRWKRVTRLH